jgi:uncharacterized membrane protein
VATAAVPAATGSGGVAPAPTWVKWTTLALAIVGVGISTYLTITHFDPTALTCSSKGIINCAKVTTSAESRFLGIPVAFLGLFQYLCMTALCTPAAWRSKRREVHLARLALATIGMGFVLWLLAAELLIIGSICLWCTGVHVITFALFICVVSTVPAMLGWNDR